MSQAQERYERRLARIAREMGEHIDLTFQHNPFRSMTRRFAVATSSRSGSYLLSERLLAHGAVVTEGFLPNRILWTCERRRLLGLEDYCRQHLAQNAVGGVFGVKGEFDILVPLAQAGEIPDHLGDWRFVHLTRANTVQQAISLLIARKTLAWRSFKAPARKMTDDDYDGALIAETIRGIARMNRTWEETFDLLGVDPMRITYEELAADPPAVVAAVAAYVGLEGPAITDPRFVNPPLERQATDLNARWEARFRRTDGRRLKRLIRTAP
ncbi:MAG: Stf0 family sulfotransferase [Caulobacteraceae bacterium]